MTFMSVAICLRCGVEFEAPVHGEPTLCVRCAADSLKSDEHEVRRQPYSGLTDLGPQNYYLICDHRDVVARWENDARGWMVYIGDGFVRVVQVADDLPWFGDYLLIEIGVQRRRRTVLTHVTGYQLREAFALTEMVKSDTAVLRTIIRPAPLSQSQKECVRAFLKSRYLRVVWQQLDHLLD